MVSGGGGQTLNLKVMASSVQYTSQLFQRYQGSSQSWALDNSVATM